MIHTSLTFLQAQLNGFLAIKDPLNLAGASMPVKLSNITGQDNQFFQTTGDYIYMTLVNTEEETVGKAQLPYHKTPDDVLQVLNPDIKLNLYIQFAGYSDNENGSGTVYERALLLLDQVIFFFQFRNVFTARQYPALQQGGVEKLIVEPVSLSFEQLNHLWATLGSKYLPSVMYKCRMLTFRETVQSTVQPLIREIITDDSSI